MMTHLVTISTEDRLTLDGAIYLPKQKTKKIVINTHGVAHNFYSPGFIQEMSKSYTNSGWAFLTMNNRGHDYINETKLNISKEKYKILGSAYENFEDCIFDIRAYIDFAVKQGYKQIVLQGHSLGATKVAYYTAKTGDKRVNGLIFGSPIDHVGLFNMKDDLEYRTGLLKKALTAIKNKQKTPLVIKRVYEETMQILPETYVSLFSRGGVSDIFNTYDEKAKSLLSKITVPIFVFLSRGEFSLKGNKKTLEIIKAKATNCHDFTYKLLTGSSHTYFGHEKEAANCASLWVTRHF